MMQIPGLPCRCTCCNSIEHDAVQYTVRSKTEIVNVNVALQPGLYAHFDSPFSLGFKQMHSVTAMAASMEAAVANGV